MGWSKGFCEGGGWGGEVIQKFRFPEVGSSTKMNIKNWGRGGGILYEGTG